MESHQRHLSIRIAESAIQDSLNPTQDELPSSAGATVRVPPRPIGPTRPPLNPRCYRTKVYSWDDANDAFIPQVPTTNDSSLDSNTTPVTSQAEFENLRVHLIPLPPIKVTVVSSGERTVELVPSQDDEDPLP